LEPTKPLAKPATPKREVIKTPKFAGGGASNLGNRKPTISTGGYNFEPDSHNRSGRTHGELRLQPDQARSRKAQRDAGKPDRQTSDHGGHFIAREFGGPEIAINHFAQDAKINMGEYRKLENIWKSDLKQGRKVTVDIVPQYEGSSRRPNSLSVTYFVNGVRKHTTISNRKGGK
jgi:predicted ribonuclease toxin of YeeF-YezG toxin-antitoxin module